MFSKQIHASMMRTREEKQNIYARLTTKTVVETVRQTRVEESRQVWTVTG